jgi:hypothetical protein
MGSRLRGNDTVHFARSACGAGSGVIPAKAGTHPIPSSPPLFPTKIPFKLPQKQKILKTLHLQISCCIFVDRRMLSDHKAANVAFFTFRAIHAFCNKQLFCKRS